MRRLKRDMLAGSVAGAIATLAMDAAGVLGRLGSVPEHDMGPGQLGRWVGYMGRGKFVHERLSEEPPLPREKELGLAAHYLIRMTLGVGYVGLLRVFRARPRVRMALAYGTATTVFPWFVVYPAYGLGRFGLKSGDGRLLRASLGAHALFGVSLGIAAATVRRRATASDASEHRLRDAGARRMSSQTGGNLRERIRPQGSELRSDQRAARAHPRSRNKSETATTKFSQLAPPVPLLASIPL